MNGTTLFSSISPDYERVVKEETWLCFKRIGIPFDTVMDMTMRDRKYYIKKHNRECEEEELERQY